MDQHPQAAAAPARWWGPSSAPSASTDVMNQLCRVCGEPAAGFHFGAFTCEGCKSFFGRTYNNLGSISECKNNGKCVITKKNRTSCKACRLRKCLMVGMSKSGSRYGRRSNWFKIHCLLQEQQQSQMPLLPSKNKGWESLLENNNSASAKDGQERERDRELSSGGLPPGYSPEAAAALWAARSSLLPVHSHHHPHPSPLTFFPPPFLQNPPFHHAPTPNFALLPFMPLRPPPTDCSPAPPSESSSSSSSPSPTEERLRSPETCSSPELATYDKTLAVFRSLGPVQDFPMDLSCRHLTDNVKQDKMSGEFEIQDQNSNIVGVGEGSSKEHGSDAIKKSPLDLTCSKT